MLNHTKQINLEPAPMVASENHRIPVSTEELATLIKECRYVECELGTGALLWKKGTPMPEAISKLGFMRGVLNENCDGAGI